MTGKLYESVKKSRGIMNNVAFTTASKIRDTRSRFKTFTKLKAKLRQTFGSKS